MNEKAPHVAANCSVCGAMEYADEPHENCHKPKAEVKIRPFKPPEPVCAVKYDADWVCFNPDKALAHIRKQAGQLASLAEKLKAKDEALEDIRVNVRLCTTSVQWIEERAKQGLEGGASKNDKSLLEAKDELLKYIGEFVNVPPDVKARIEQFIKGETA